MTEIPAQCKDPKDAVLYAVLHSLEQIDANTSSRAMYAQSILFNISANLDGPCFGDEVRQIKEVLGIKAEEPAPACMVPEVVGEAKPIAERPDTFVQEL